MGWTVGVYGGANIQLWPSSLKRVRGCLPWCSWWSQSHAWSSFINFVTVGDFLPPHMLFDAWATCSRSHHIKNSDPRQTWTHQHIDTMFTKSMNELWLTTAVNTLTHEPFSTSINAASRTDTTPHDSSADIKLQLINRVATMQQFSNKWNTQEMPSHWRPSKLARSVWIFQQIRAPAWKRKLGVFRRILGLPPTLNGGGALPRADISREGKRARAHPPISRSVRWVGLQEFTEEWISNCS
jgi:hypothetical protein